MINCRYSLFLLLMGMKFALPAQEFQVLSKNGAFIPAIWVGEEVALQAPMEGLWSIATAWQDDWPANWHHAAATQQEQAGPWTVLQGKLSLPQGDWLLQDAYKPEKGLIKCIRRFTWTGETPLDSITLSVRWKVSAMETQAFLPGILYYGNPSGEKNGMEKVAVFHGKEGEAAIFEEHRYPMPFACLEWSEEQTFHGAALHSLPSPVYNGHIEDQWWSMGVQVNQSDTELVLLSGPITYNGQKSVAKALQRNYLPYRDTYMKVIPGTVIEKTFYLEAYPVTQKGTAFQKPLYTSLDLFKPFYTEDLPPYEEIVADKYRFALSRWVEGEGYAGFNMYPDHVPPRIVLGWAGQSEAPVYALQVLAGVLGDSTVWDKVQRAMDHISTSPMTEQGFPVRYEIAEDRWHRPDPVSEGQAMNSIAMAIRRARMTKKLEYKTWEEFLQRACDIHARRILENSWSPRNTAEAFYIAPLLKSGKLFKNDLYTNAALKATHYYADRHLDMTEPYWGGTLDATCEDKEGAWGAFQGFLAAYEFTKEEKYLQWAQHAGDVVLSYTAVWDIPLPPGRMSDHYFKTRGWTGVSAQNQHLDVYGVVMTPAIYKLGLLTNNDSLKRLAEVMYRSCGQMIDPFGAHGEQLQHTNFAQHGNMSDIYKLRGGYSEKWTVFWITAHFLHAAAQFAEMGVRF